MLSQPPRRSPIASRRSICRRSRCRMCSASSHCARPRRARRCRRWPMPASSSSIRSARRHPRRSLPAAGGEISPPRQDAMLVRWGYPYVFDTWFFHLTLTRRLSAAEKQLFMPAAETYFARAIATPRRVTDICLFVQPGPGRTVRHPGTPDAGRLRHRDNQVNLIAGVLSLRLIAPRYSERRSQGIETLAPGAGLEPATQRLTAACSTN